MPDHQVEVIEGQQLVSTFTEVIFRVNVVNQMAAPTSASLVAVVDLNTGTDVLSDISGSTSASIEDTTYVKLPKLSSFTANRKYSVRFSFSNADNKLPGEIPLECVF